MNNNTSRINSIEVTITDDEYWIVDYIEIFDSYQFVITIEIDYQQINQPFEDSIDMLQHVAEYLVLMFLRYRSILGIEEHRPIGNTAQLKLELTAA
jgi:hypothetical protein